ncbi:hypothetical protein HYU89_01390 [Candidatus Collierbacteria bacterium]|nr:hypothetical protein [Candidatus Collierbacteria bacterium]
MRVWAVGLVTNDAPNSLADIETVIKNLLGSAASLIGLAIFVMLVVGAFQYITSGADQKAVEKSRQVFTFALMGGAAIIILWLVFVFLKEFTGIDLLKFNICIFQDEFCKLP